MILSKFVDSSILPKIKPRQAVILGIVASLTLGGVLLSQVVRNQVLQAEKENLEQQVIPEIKTVTALGRLEPEGEVINLASSSSGQGSQGNKIDKLLVKEGEEVKAG